MSLTKYDHNTNNKRSLFDSIKHFDDQSNEFWYARELMKLLGYKKWERFEGTIQKAKVSCQNSGNPG